MSDTAICKLFLSLYLRVPCESRFWVQIYHLHNEFMNVGCVRIGLRRHIKFDLGRVQPHECRGNGSKTRHHNLCRNVPHGPTIWRTGPKCAARPAPKRKLRTYQRENKREKRRKIGDEGGSVNGFYCIDSGRNSDVLNGGLNEKSAKFIHANCSVFLSLVLSILGLWISSLFTYS